MFRLMFNSPAGMAAIFMTAVLIVWKIVGHLSLSWWWIVAPMGVIPAVCIAWATLYTLYVAIIAARR